MQTPDLMPDHKAQLPRQSHVLSHDFGFTATTGHLLPVFHTFMNPGEKINVGFDFNLRTMQLEAAAFADLVTHVEYFFVPIQLLYQPFENIFYDIQNQFSSNFTLSDKAVLPLLDFEGCMDDLFVNRAESAINYPEAYQSVESVGQSAMRLLDMLGFNPIPVACGIQQQGGANWYMPNVFPYQLLAYHCIYEYYYRLDSRERFDNELFNWDRFYKTALVANENVDNNFFMLHYRPLRNDYFTDVKVSPIVDVLNLNDKTSLDASNQWLTRSTMYSSRAILSSGSIGSTSGYYNIDAPTGSANNSPSSDIQTNFGFYSTGVESHGGLYDLDNIPVNGQDFNTANIRALFANEKLWSITGRAKKTYDDQTLAHFGFKVPHDVKHEITCFGKDEGRIHIGEVIATANTANGESGSPLGEIAGKGYGSQSGNRHSFVAPCHGVMMAIFSVECVHNYEAGIAKENAVASKYDFFIPEYDHLGMQPLFSYETMYQPTDSGSYNPSSIVGWQYRYEQWKRRYNRTSGAFRNTTGSLKSWIPTFAPYGGNYSYIGEAGKTQNLPNSNSYQSFLNFPTDVNQIFLAQYPSLWSATYETEDMWSAIYDNDPFVINSHIDCTLVSEMSDYSLPRLDA